MSANRTATGNQTSHKPVTGVIIRIALPGHEAKLEDLIDQLCQLARQQPGYIGHELFPPVSGIQNAYVLLYRFQSARLLREWLQHPQRAELFASITPHLAEPVREYFLVSQSRPAGSVSAVFNFRIKPDYCEAFIDWRARMLDTVRQSPGFISTEYYESIEDNSPEHVSVVRFDCRDSLNQWIKSPARATMLEEVKLYVEDFYLSRVNTGFEGWFNQPDGPNAGTSQLPKPWRQALIIVAVLGPLILAQQFYLYPFLQEWPRPIDLYLGLVINIALMTFFLMPLVTRRMHFWLVPQKNATWRTEVLGLGIIILVTGIALALGLHLMNI